MSIRPFAIFIVLSVLGTVVHAQNTMFLRQSPIAHLDDEDRKILRETIERALESPDGTLIEWSNPDSGSNGRVKVLDTLDDSGITCRNLRARNQSRGRQADGIYRLCKDETGKWRFASAGNVTPAAPDTEATETGSN